MKTARTRSRAPEFINSTADYFVRDDGTPTPGWRDWRGSVETTGKFALSPMWTFGWDGVLVSDPTFFQNYRIRSLQQRNADPFGYGLTEGISQLYLTGRGDRSYFDARAIHYTGFSEADVQSALPIIHPVLDYSRTLETPILGGELGYSVNLTSLSRASADFDPISSSASSNNSCAPATADPAVKTPANCLLRGIPGDYTRLSAESTLAPADHRHLRSDLDTVRVGARRCRQRQYPIGCRRLQFHYTWRKPDQPGDADSRSRISLSVHRRAVVGHTDHRADRAVDRSSRRAAQPASCRTKTRKASSTTTPTCSRSTSSPAGTAPKAADA